MEWVYPRRGSVKENRDKPARQDDTLKCALPSGYISFRSPIGSVSQPILDSPDSSAFACWSRFGSFALEICMRFKYLIRRTSAVILNKDIQRQNDSSSAPERQLERCITSWIQPNVEAHLEKDEEEESWRRFEIQYIDDAKHQRVFISSQSWNQSLAASAHREINDHGG
ncbi:uncharacterized protein BJ212DRAFT_1590463 [Suillus subaureus]|uniref:Uncharacterized protein n=1 Tax=Suillus subaureus TaxID=48587 RepID=A0A9P7DZR9_9AGAM|nr:uncharacterized protein BJ212DRAFT_1590463 [Suillus subaureus]KAG1807288.1 hypothetical protein BJ212DRAFT_1590463 [Suillus subaureus]